MKSTSLTLICHAPTEAQRIGRFHLVDEPIRTAVATRPALPLATQQRVAPERRARQTAEALGLNAHTEEALRDCDLGCWQGLSLKQLEQDDPLGLQAWLGDPYAAPHGGESVAQLCTRVAQWMDSALLPGNWLAVTHPMVIRAAMLHVLGSPLEAFQRIDVLALGEVQFSRYGSWRMRVVANG